MKIGFEAKANDDDAIVIIGGWKAEYRFYVIDPRKGLIDMDNYNPYNQSYMTEVLPYFLDYEPVIFLSALKKGVGL